MQKSTSKHKLAYNAYKFLFKSYKNEKDSNNLVYWIRMLECAVNEAGINGTSTKLISVEALESKIKKAKGEFVSSLDNVSLEHPVTYRVLAEHCLSQETLMSYDQFIQVWEYNLVTTIVTARQNKMLIKHQKNFKLGDSWHEMYAKQAKIKLVADPDLRNDNVRAQFGLPPIQRGRKKNDKKIHLGNISKRRHPQVSSSTRRAAA